MITAWYPIRPVRTLFSVLLPLPPSLDLVRQFLREPDDPIESLLNVVGRGGVRQPHVAIVSECRTGHERNAGCGDQARAEIRPADPSKRIHSEKEVEGAERLDELHT